MSNFLFTSESVTEGHPDKICDQISDAVLDAVLEQDPDSRVAIECAVKTGLVFLFGELSTNGYVDFQSTARKVIEDIGYTRAKFGFDFETCGVISSVSEQSPDIAHAVIEGEEITAGDQGMMFGYACKETAEYMPLPITLAHALARQLSAVRHNGICEFLRPDGKTQITVEYKNGIPQRVHTVVLSTQHDPDISQAELRSQITEHVILPTLEKWIDADTIFHINPSGKFVMGGPQADAGLTGRKIIVDTYGGYAPHGGGAFSGKDPSKVDRSGAYAARYIAKNLVAAGLAEKCQIELSYAIGIAEPISILVETFGSAQKEQKELENIIRKHFPLKPVDMITELELKQPIYQKTATYGHFGRNDVPWERIDKKEILQQYL